MTCRYPQIVHYFHRQSVDTNRGRCPQTACCMCTLILSQWIKHDQLSFRVHTISTVSLWTQWQESSDRMLHVYTVFLDQWIKHDQLSFTVYTIPLSVCGHKQSQESSDRMLHVYTVILNQWINTIPLSVCGHKQSQKSSDRMLYDCVYCLPQSTETIMTSNLQIVYYFHHQSVDTFSRRQCLHTVCFYPQCIYGNTHDQLPFDYCFQPQAMDIIIQSNAALVYIYPQCIIIWKNP